MSLLEELKEKRIEAVENIDELKDELSAAEKEAANARRSITFWETHISELDKAIAALSTETERGLLDPESPPVDDEVRNQAEGASPEVASEGEAGSNIQKVNITQPAVPEGWTPAAEFQFDGPVGADVPEDERDETWAPPPGYTYIPTQGERCVCVNLMQDGIGNFFCCNQRGETSADAERTSDESQAETAIEQTLITDDIPSIPREEIPIGAAVETYTDSGIETVKLGGQTYVVDDEPERQAETQPEAAYAPVNEDEARMWSNGFEADAKSKAEPEQDKRPFWMFAKKVDA